MKVGLYTPKVSVTFIKYGIREYKGFVLAMDRVCLCQIRSFVAIVGSISTSIGVDFENIAETVFLSRLIASDVH